MIPCEACGLNPAKVKVGWPEEIHVCLKCAQLDMNTLYELKNRETNISKKHFLGGLYGSWIKHLDVVIPPHNKEDFLKQYGMIDYENKIVLDVGAERGSTPAFFLQWGAKHVIAVEGGKIRFKNLLKNIEKYNLSTKITPIHMWIDCKKQFEELIMDHKPDVAKIDCEGCEENLISASDEIFCLVPEYMIETHGEEITENMIKKLTGNGYEIVWRDDWSKNASLIYARSEVSE